MTDATSTSAATVRVDPAEFRRWTDALWHAVWEAEPNREQLNALKGLAAWMDAQAYRMDGQARD